MFCNQVIQKKTSYSAKIYYFAKQSENCTIVSYMCNFCKIYFYSSYYIESNGIRKFYENSINEKYIAFTNETVFEILLFKSLTMDIIYKHSSYSGFANAHNALFDNQNDDENDRNILIYKRLGECWLYYNLLIFVKEYFGKLSDFKAPFIQDLDSTLTKQEKNFYGHFKKKWLSHSYLKICEHPKCSSALNIDGNHKVTRLTCLCNSKLVTSEEFSSSAYVSCPKTPTRNSYYCDEHANSETSLPFNIDNRTEYIKINDIQCTPSTNIKESLKDSMKIHDAFLDKDDKILYLVSYAGKFVWLNEESLPKETLGSFLSYWNSSQEKEATESTCTVRKDMDYPCNNKTRTKGVLLAVYNCGIIGGYQEIFNNESLLQVSLFILDLLECTPKFIIYDDACHLHPYIVKNQKFTDDKLKIFQQKLFTIDRLHIHNHTRPICKTFNSNLFMELNGVNSVVM